MLIRTACACSLFVNAFIFFFNDTAPPDISTLSLHDALPIYGGRLIVESGVSDEAVEELKKRGHNVSRGGSGGGYQAIRIDYETGLLHGGSEARKDGAAIGY